MPEGHELAGWWCRASVDFPARIIGDLRSSDAERVMAVFRTIFLEHNFPDSDGAIAKTLEDVDPFRALAIMAGAVFEEIARLPPR